MSESKASVARAGASGKVIHQGKVAARHLKSRVALAIFVRAPQRGQVKTRLARTLGGDAALQLYVAMLRDTLALARRAMRKSRGETIVFFTPLEACDSNLMAREYSHEKLCFRTASQTRRVLLRPTVVAHRIAREYSLRGLWNGATFPQSDGDLGKKMRDCCETLRARGAHRVVIIGSDLPDLPPEMIAAAFAALKHCDLVFGPAQDGGFYLLGASRRFPRAVFSGVRWSRADVLSRVLANARREKMRVFLLPAWRDVDDVRDLRALKNRLRARRSDLEHDTAFAKSMDAGNVARRRDQGWWGIA